MAGGLRSREERAPPIAAEVAGPVALPDSQIVVGEDAGAGLGLWMSRRVETRSRPAEGSPLRSHTNRPLGASPPWLDG